MNQLSRFTRASSFTSYLALGCVALFALVSGALAQDEGKRRAIEEVVVTAQRSEQGLQDVPIAVTALSGAMLEERQVINPSDLQLNTPNVSFTATNFGSSSTSIRGIGRLVIATSGEAGVSNHINEIPIASNQNAIEFFDVERVEILRGPQGTLFGRNATGGSVNMVTKMPEFDSVHGFVDAEIGDFNNVRFKGAFNLPLAENLAVRFAGFDLKRDGYIKNLAFGQVGLDGQTLPDLNEDVDGRNLSAFRITALWDITDNANLWVQYNNFSENDDRVRITNQVCKTTALPTTGCEPDEEGFQGPNLASNTGALFAIFNGAIPPLPGGSNSDANKNAGLVYNFERPAEVGLRAMHTDFQPIFKQDEENILFGMDIELGPFSLGILSAYQETEHFSRQDYNMDVGPNLNPTPLNPSGNYPTAQIPLGVNGDQTGPCSLIDPTNPGLGRAGSGPHHQTKPGEGGPTDPNAAPIVHPCIHPSDQSRIFSYDQVNAVSEYWTSEITLASNFDGRLNFNAGVSGYALEISSDYYVVSNTLDLAVYNGVPAGTRLYPGYFNSRTNLLKQDGIAAFGEVYFDLTDSLKITAGARFNQDNKDILDSGVLVNSAFAGGRYIRATLAPLLAPTVPSANRAAVIDLALMADQLEGASEANVMARLLARYNTPEQLTAAKAAQDAAVADPRTTATAIGAFFGIAGRVPIVPAPGESRATQVSPTENTWEEVTGRIGIDWNITNDILVYGFYTRGYKPGGFNPNVADELRGASPFELTFDAETIDSVEFGAKTTFFDGRMTLNGSAFIYDYKNLQITRIQNNSSLNENIDAEISGIELELVWVPFDRLTLDASYSFLDSSIKNGQSSVDPIGRTVGDTDNEWRILTNLQGASTGVNYIARADVINPTVLAGLAPLGATPFANAANSYAATDTLPAIPVHIHRGALQGTLIAVHDNITVDNIGDFVRDGLFTDLGGNELPNSPEHTIHFGVTLRQNIEAIRGEVSLRYDVYWQSESFARDFNTVGDKIDAWAQHNLSLNYNGSDGVIQGRLWVRNMFNKNNVTGKYLTSDTSGLYRNFFLTEPRIFGASIRYNFGL